MPEYPIRDSIITSLNAQEPWPDNVKLFQPYEVEQILLPDNASCLAVQAFLKMCNLPFEVEMRWNAEWMSPSGRVPFIKCGAFVVSELEPIVQFAANKNVSLCGRLATEDKAEMRAYMSLITNVLVNAELYVSWVDNETFNTVTKVRNSSVYPWPLGWIQTRAKRNMVAKRLKALHWYDKTLEQVLADVEQCCNSLSQRLGEKDYFFGTPTPLDALVYGHMRALLSATGPKAAFMIKPITSALLRHVLRVANLTEMKLTTQEEYLLTQAFQVSRKRRMSPDGRSSERSARIRRSRLSIRNASRDSITYNRDVFGFKPFASKQIIMMTSKEGGITCQLGGRRATVVRSIINEEQMTFVMEIIEDILDKVEELSFTGKLEFEKNDFEVIAYPNQDLESKFGSIVTDEFLETIEVETLLSSPGEDIIHIINDEDDEIMDSDGLVNEKHLSSHAVDEVNESDLKMSGSLEVDSSNNNETLEGYLTVTSSGDRYRTDSARNLSVKSERSTKSANSTKSAKTSRFSSESNITLTMPSNEEISVESLLRHLRRRNAAYHNYADVADVD